MGRFKALSGVVAILGSVALADIILVTGHFKPAVREPMRIGINHSPPYAMVGADGTVSGVSFEIINEAARRQGIALHWVVVPEGPDHAIKAHMVDLWHLVTDIPERHKYIRYTDPWLRTSFGLITRMDGSIRDVAGATGKRISYTDSTFQLRLAHQFFPQSTLSPLPYGDELPSLCQGYTDGVLLEAKNMVSRLLEVPRECASLPLRLVPLAGPTYQMAIGATDQGFAAAQALRTEITSMAQDHALESVYRKWLFDNTDETKIVGELAEARQRTRRLRYSAAILAAAVVCLIALIYRERAARRAIRAAYEFASGVLDTAGGLVFITDRSGRIVRFNQACQRATGKTLRDVEGRHSWELFVPPEERLGVEGVFARLAGGGPTSNHEYHWETLDGTRLFSWSNTVLMNPAGRPEFIIATGIDISEREAAEEKLGYEASHDPLTNLANRRRFMRELEAAVTSAEAGGPMVGLALADLDNFKIVNDTFGHAAGDEVLVYFAHLLRDEMGPGGMAGRLGGDEFCLLIQGSEVETGQIQSRCERMKQRLNDKTFHWEGGTFHAGVTFGFAAWRNPLQPPDLLRAADQSLYHEKGHERYVRFKSNVAALGMEIDAGPSPEYLQK